MGDILLDIVLVLVAAKLAGELFERLRQPAVLGEMLAGVLLGPSLLGWVALDGAAGGLVEFLAAFGVVLLLFEVGLESNVRDLLRVGPSATLVGLIGIGASFALGFAGSALLAATTAWPSSFLVHVFVGATFTATSVGITARVLSDMGKLATREASIVLGAAVLDDVGGLLILAVVVSAAAGTLSLAVVGVKLGLALLFLVGSVGLGLALMPRLTTEALRFRVRGVLLALSVAFCLALAYLAEVVGLAAIVGAFAAGLVLAQTRESSEIAHRVRPVADLLVPFFFVSIGLHIDFAAIFASDLALVLTAAGVLTVAAVLGKLASGWGVREHAVSRLAVGVGMLPRGEVGLIFALFGLTTLVDGAPLLAPWMYGAVLLVIVATTVASPLLLRATFRHAPTRRDLAADVGHIRSRHMPPR